MISFLRRNSKIISRAFLIIIAQSTLAPIAALALTTGPAQTEFTSYESSGSTDLVNLLTGDFTYTLPLLQVPGPEGAFSVPLFYHAGISPEQDASWVGLGFNMNVGSISREISGYADDAYDQSVTTNVNDPGGSGWVKNYILYKRTFDTEKGYGAGVSLFNVIGADWDRSGLQTGTLVGLTFNKSGVKGEVIDNVFSVANAAYTVLSFGLGSGAAAGVKASATEIGMSALQSAVSIGSTLYQGYLSQGTFSSRYFSWSQEQRISNLGFKLDYKYWLDDTREERGFGSLYLGSTDNSTISFPGNTTYNGDGSEWPYLGGSSQRVKGFKFSNNGVKATSDMFTYVSPSDNYGSTAASSHIAYDNFSVMTDGVSGLISPYRLETGSLSQPKRYSFRNDSHNLIPFIAENDPSNKVQFYYPGQFSNKYLYHDDATFGVSTSIVNGSYKVLSYDVSSNKLKTDRIEVDPTRIANKKVASGKNIEWFTNEQINSGTTANMGFIDGVSQKINRQSAPARGIGGFMITKEDGLTYHYAIPVFRSSEIEFMGKKGQETTKYSKSFNTNKVAITWLLTAITGPDFIDRGQSGVIDDADWGYWVKFDYGSTTSNYAYRAPYYGYIDDGTTYRYSFGLRDEYYLNSIQTRTHVALFIKGSRNDGLSAYRILQNSSSGHPSEATDYLASYAPVTPLYLDEIALLTKQEFKNLTSLGFNESLSTMTGVSFTLASVYDVTDVAADANYRAFLDTKSLTRIKFGYETTESNKLCKKALNCFDPSNPPYSDASDIYAYKLGKLTLRRVQLYGKNSVKILPDYKFDYASNPDYDKDKWDGWGQYSSAGTASVSSHTASSSNTDASAWSLTQITLPTGGKLNVEYERDTYGSISGQEILENPIPFSASNYTAFNSTGAWEVKGLVNTSGFNRGDEVRIQGNVAATCAGSTSMVNVPYSGHYTISSVTANSITFFPGSGYMNLPCALGTTVTINSNVGTVNKVVKNKKGGNIRVAAISFTDDLGSVNKTKYEYNLSDNVSSGVVAREPDFIKDLNMNPDNFGLDKYYDYPSTPVLYSSVTVLSQYNKNTADYAQRQVFEFEVPDKTFISENKTPVFDGLLSSYDYVTSGNNFIASHNVYLKHYVNKIDVKTARIGKIKSIKTYDMSNNEPVESVVFNYTEATPNDQGKYSSGSINSEFTSLNGATDAYTFRLIRTNKIFYPYVLTSTVHTKDGFSDVKEYNAWDFFTGSPLSIQTTSAMGTGILEEYLPAYAATHLSGGSPIKTYPSMGLKSLNSANKNMLTQVAASYTYLTSGGSTVGLISATTQTWKNSWANYRFYDGNAYVPGNEPESNANPVWRKGAAYSYTGSIADLLPGKGVLSFTASNKFNFAPSASNIGWRYIGETTHFDHFGMPLQSKDFKNVYVATKMSADNSDILCQATNARFGEMAFSGAEEKISGIPYFAGEVGVGETNLVMTKPNPTHTGDRSLAVSTDKKGFIFKSDDITIGREYRASVWTTNANGRIYYVGAGGEIIAPAVISSPVMIDGTNWYRIESIIPRSATTSKNLEVGVIAPGETITFDDFRFQPSDAVMVCYVKPLKEFVNIPSFPTYKYVLDNDNLFSKVEFNDKNQPVRTYRESIKYGVKLASEAKNNFSRSTINP